MTVEARRAMETVMPRFPVSSLLSLALLLVAEKMAFGADEIAGKWRAVSLNGAALARGSFVTLEFRDGRLSGNASCNSFGASYRIDGATLSISQAMSTQMACAPALMAQERLVFSILAGETQWTIANGELTIVGANGASLRAQRIP